jgi:lipoprotein-anchoring transpeptidase ErfK/SrfK/predicted negative regulator of RcsB-dependent stress response
LIFAPRRNNTLLKIVLSLLVIALAAFGAVRAWTWFNQTGAATAFLGSTADELQAARALYDQGSLQEARQALQPLVNRGRDDAATAQAVMLLARIEVQDGHKDVAKGLLERGCQGLTSNPEYPRMAIAYAQILEDIGQFDEAFQVYQDVHEKAAHDVRAPATAGLGRHAERNKDLLKARELYREAVKDAAPESKEWNDALDALGKVNVALVFLHQETPESKWYTVAKGDSITSIGNALNTTQGMLMRANGIDENTVLSMGQRLIYTPKDFRIVIERSRRRLFLLDKDGVFKRYSLGLGKPGHETTLGSYKIGNKEKNPIWHKPGFGPIPSGDPANELGTRWMPLVPDQEGLPKDLGIHGTIHPETVGQYTSNGCARLYPEDVEELYDLVVRSTPVDILDTFSLDKGVTTASPDASGTAEAKS